MKIKIQSSSGFTFIEVLISLFCLALIGLGVTGVFRQFSRSEAYVTDTLNKVRDGNNAMNRIAEELKYAEIVNPPTADGSELTFSYYQETLVRKIFLRGNSLFLNNGGGDILVAQNVNSIQFQIEDSVNKIVSINAKIQDCGSTSTREFELNTTVKLMNSKRN